jgi:two-component system CheB/CheR fusion protein
MSKLPADQPESDTAAARPSLVVGLGASAGGITALQQFFALVPPASGIAYVVVLHLSPDHESRLAELLQHATVLPVLRVSETTDLLPDRVYVISPNTSLRIEDGRLLVSDVLRLEERRAPVDIFFRTLADTYGPHAVAIVLSGTGPNGSHGIKRVKERGGLVIAQDPAEAEHDDMPRNSVATGAVDYVLRVAEIPARVGLYNTQHGADAPSSPPLPPDVAADTLRDILALVRVRTGQDFSNYKPATVMRRIERRQTLHDLPDLPAYARFLRQHPGEAVALLKELLISVTQFFRDPAAFAALEKHVVTRLIAGKNGRASARVWVAGCASGEEAYSVAMLFMERAMELPQEPAIQIFATDLDEAAVACAREGFYTDADVADVPIDRLRRFFTREPGGYRVKRELREAVLFAHHNVLKDPPFSHLDLVCCRNLLIYLNRTAQQAILETFHFALNPGGYLMLGTSETADGSGDLFDAVDKDAHLFEARPMPARTLPPFAAVHAPPAVPFSAPASRQVSPAPLERFAASDLHLQLLELYGPPSIVIDEEHHVVHVSPGAGQYLQVAGGELSRDLLKMVRPELRVDLRLGLYQAITSRSAVVIPGLSLLDGSQARTLKVAIRPRLGDGDQARGFVLVQFEETEAPAGTASGPAPAAFLVPDVAARIEEELSRVKSQLRSAIEQHETEVEEAKASNEELQAVNEELRSAAEELETSKEELQSVNEELTTVNQELKIKIEELGLTNNDFQNLINSTQIGTIFLDRSLRVKLSTPRARDVFNLLPLDVGRPLSDITSSVLYDGLTEDAELVLEQLQTVEREVQSRDGRWFLARVLPYRTTDQRIEGVVMTFQDITDRRAAERRVRANEEWLRLLIDSVQDYAILTLHSDGTVASWNAGARRLFGYDDGEIIGRPVALLFTAEDQAAGVPARELAVAARDGRAEDERWHQRKDGSRFYCSGVTTTLGEGAGVGFAKIARDLTGPREAAEALRRIQESVEETVRTRTAQLREEVAARADAERRITALVRLLVTAQEDERARVARDIHDHVGQQLTALRLSLERMERAAGETQRGELARLQDLAREIDGAIDFLAWELRPAALDDLGLVAALSKYLTAWSDHHAIGGEFRSAGLKDQRLAPETETMFYRITQEALNNAAKHAHASRVDVLLERRDEWVVLVVEDDGVGFELEGEHHRGGLGLVGMRERAALAGATLQIETAPGKGTTVFVRKPFQERD